MKRSRRQRRRCERVIVFRRAGNEIHIEEGRDVWWHRELEYVDANCPPTPLDSEHPLYILYTSGSTGKPKGFCTRPAVICVGIYSTTKYVFDLQRRRCLLVHRGCRLGDRAQLRCLWPAREWRDDLDVRRRAEFAGTGPLLAHHRRISASIFSTPRRRRSARSCAGAIEWLEET